MRGGDLRGKIHRSYGSRGEENKTYPMARLPAPVTPKMLVKALKRLRKAKFKRLLFTPREITHEILRSHLRVEQDPQALLLEVCDKLSCAAAAGLLGTKDDRVYFAFDRAREGGKTDSRSELMFWIYYKKLLKRSQMRLPKKEGQRESDSYYASMNNGRAGRKKTVRMMSFTDDHLRVLPLMRYRRRILHMS